MRLVRSWLGVLCAVILLASPASAQVAPASTAGAAAPDLAALRSIESQVAQIRGLQPLAEPDLKLLDHVSLHTYLAGQFDKDYLPNEREADQKQWVALGLIKSTDDVVQIQLSLLTDQVIGVYDPDTKSLIVVGDQGAFGPTEKMTYAHEFNHALQDQWFDLNGLAPKHNDSSDRSLAIHAVIEGDAIMLQTLWASQNLTQDELIQMSRAAASSPDDSLARVPLIVRTELLFPYVEGFNFVRNAYRQGGNKYAAIDELFKNPPVSTAQLLHFEKYANDVQPVDVQLPDLASQLEGGWRRVGSGVLGELDTRVLLEQWGTDHGDAMRVASGWAGDRWQLVEKDGRSAIVVKSTWETPGAAQSYFSAYSSGLRKRFDSAMTEESSSTRQALTTPTAATDLRIDGSNVTTVLAFDRDSANALVAQLN
ncbi:MAG TPA: hypothetical protein VGQ62_16305 [Chloroflexota bacterium]|jgi:hypothetical protein|nr:hypothetical protein [Chloroflexota bacterium]